MEKMFPIQGDSARKPGQVPWSIAEIAYATYAVKHGSQSLEGLANRGGFSWEELVNLLKGTPLFDPAWIKLPERVRDDA